ncbi:major capsid protein [Bacillus cereus]|nr:major capsid protein [Bacillus cereus]
MAGITHLDEFKKPALRGFVDEQVKEMEPTVFDTYLPDGETYSTKFAYDIVKETKHIGAMIGFGAEPPIMDREKVASMSGEIAKLGLKYIATEEELLAINQARSNSEKQAVIDKLLVKGSDLVDAIKRRATVMKAEALAQGKLKYSKNGAKIEVDFGIPAEHKVALTSTDDWDKPDHDVLADLFTWVETYEQANGISPDVMLMSREVFGKLTKNKGILAEAGRKDGVRASQAEVNTVLGDHGLPPVQIVKDRKATVRNVYNGQDEVIEFMPVNRVIFLSNGIGEFLYGPTVENDFKPGIVLDAYDKQEPIESILRSVASGFPTIEKPSLIFHADVFTPKA